MFATICILIWLISTIIWIILTYIEEKRWLYNVGDLIDEIEYYMWFPIINTVILIGFILLWFPYKILILLKLDILWEKFRNIKLK